jgi:hypothetical protein
MPMPFSIKAFLGTCLHSTFEHIMSPTHDVPSLHSVQESFLLMWNKCRQIDHESDEVYVTDALKMIKSFYDTNKGLRDYVFAVEKHFVLPMENHEIVGYIDRIDKTPNAEHYEIIDYKTGDTRYEKESMSRNLQLGIYALALMADSPLLPPERVVVSIDMTKYQEKISYEPSMSDLRQVQDDVLSTIHDIEHAQETGVYAMCHRDTCDVCSAKNSAKA